MTFGREASAFTKQMAEGQQVSLEYERGSPGSVLLDYHHDLVALWLLSEILVGSFQGSLLGGSAEAWHGHRLDGLIDLMKRPRNDPHHCPVTHEAHPPSSELGPGHVPLSRARS